MKRILSTLAIVFVMMTSLTAFAGSKSLSSKTTESTKTVKNYLSFVNTADLKLHKNLFTADFEYLNKANGTKCNKREFVKFINDNKALNYNCTTTYEVLDECAQTAVAKITMDFGHFTRVDHVALTKEKDDWKISKITTDYQ